MSFNTGLSGLNAANKALNVTGNNIANVATTGFKASRAEFADQYSNSIRGTSGGKKVCDAQLKLRTMPFSEIPLGPIVKKRAEEVGLMAAIAADTSV